MTTIWEKLDIIFEETSDNIIFSAFFDNVQHLTSTEHS